MNEDEQTVVNNYTTELKDYVQEWNGAFITGSKDVNDDAVWKDYCDGFAKLHIDELTAAYQSAYDRFIK